MRYPALAGALGGKRATHSAEVFRPENAAHRI